MYFKTNFTRDYSGARLGLTTGILRTRRRRYMCINDNLLHVVALARGGVSKIKPFFFRDAVISREYKGILQTDTRDYARSRGVKVERRL